MQLVLGTKEYIDVFVRETSDQVTDLSGTSPTYSVFTVDEETDLDVTELVTNASTDVGIDLMTLKCLVDTSGGSPWVVGKYRLYAKFNYFPQVIALDPVEFFII